MYSSKILSILLLVFFAFSRPVASKVLFGNQPAQKYNSETIGLAVNIFKKPTQPEIISFAPALELAADYGPGLSTINITAFHLSCIYW